MSLPYAVAPGAGARDALTGGATVPEETEDAEAERIKTKVAAMVVSRPGRMVRANTTMGTRHVNFTAVTTPNGSRGAGAPNYDQPGQRLCSRPWLVGATGGSAQPFACGPRLSTDKLDSAVARKESRPLRLTSSWSVPSFAGSVLTIPAGLSRGVPSAKAGREA